MIQTVYLDKFSYTVGTSGGNIAWIKDCKGDLVSDYRVRKAVKARLFGRYTALLFL